MVKKALKLLKEFRDRWFIEGGVDTGEQWQEVTDVINLLNKVQNDAVSDTTESASSNVADPIKKFNELMALAGAGYSYRKENGQQEEYLKESAEIIEYAKKHFSPDNQIKIKPEGNTAQKEVKMTFGLTEKNLEVIEKYMIWDGAEYSDKVWECIGLEIGWHPLTAALWYFRKLAATHPDKDNGIEKWETE